MYMSLSHIILSPPPHLSLNTGKPHPACLPTPPQQATLTQAHKILGGGGHISVIKRLFLPRAFLKGLIISAGGDYFSLFLSTRKSPIVRRALCVESCWLIPWSIERWASPSLTSLSHRYLNTRAKKLKIWTGFFYVFLCSGFFQSTFEMWSPAW